MSNNAMNKTAEYVLDKHFPNYIYPVTNNERKLILAAMEEYRSLPTPATEPSPSVEQMAEAFTDMQRLYEWLMDDNRKKAQTFFTAGELRNVAKEIEFRLSSRPLPQADKVEDAVGFAEWMLEECWEPININVGLTNALTKYVWSSRWGEGQKTSSELYQLYTQSLTNNSKL